MSRSPDATELAIHPLVPERVPDFDRVHAETWGCGWCQCVAWWVPTWDGWAARSAEDNRSLRNRLFLEGEYDGFLLYKGDEPVGWMQVGPIGRLPKLWNSYRLDELTVTREDLAISCVFLAPSYRGQGFLHAFLAGALQSLAATEREDRAARTVPESESESPEGRARSRTDARKVLAFPLRGKRPSADVWTGPDSVFSHAGFAELRPDENRPVLARDLIPGEEGETDPRVSGLGSAMSPAVSPPGSPATPPATPPAVSPAVSSAVSPAPSVAASAMSPPIAPASADRSAVRETDGRHTVILFDLGGVLVDNAGIERLLECAPGLTPAELWTRWLASPAVRNFESGRTDRRDFTEALVREFSLQVEPEALEREITAWIRGFYPGVPELLAALRSQARLACLSNTNEAHWERMLEELDLYHVLDHRFLSFRMGLLKPDQEAFAHVTEALKFYTGGEPRRILFLDDHPDNIAGARRHGIDARRTIGIESVRQELIRCGFDPGPGFPDPQDGADNERNPE